MAMNDTMDSGGDGFAAVGEFSGNMENIDNGERVATLDEPVMDTLRRDLRAIAIKLKFVLMPRGSQEEIIAELRNWDLWGPLLLCMLLSVILSMRAPDGHGSVIFALVFVVVWLGSAAVTLNAQLLGGKVSFFQSVCVLGYCIFPMVLAALVSLIWSNAVFRLIVVVLSFVWSTRASVLFMSQLVEPERKALAAYPALLFYVCISWMVFM